MAEFSQRFKQLRAANGYSQQELADLLDVSKSTVNMYERGERRPGISQLEAVADFFNVDMDYLSGKSDIPRKSFISCVQKNILDNCNETEEKLVENYRKLDEYGQSTVNLIINAELKRCTEQGTIKKVRSFRAARSSDNCEPEVVEMEDLSIYPESDIEDI